jgi:fatty-acyl-CoA synthase
VSARSAWVRKTLWDVLVDAVANCAERDVLVLRDERIGYADLLQRARATASALHEYGVTRGDRVAVWLTNSVEWIVTMFAVARLGAVLVPINTRYADSETDYVISHSQPRVLIFEPVFSGKYDALAMLQRLCPDADLRRASERWKDLRHLVCVGRAAPAATVSFDALWKRAANVNRTEWPAISPDDPAVIQYTSGTTGRPKGAVLTHNSVAEDAHWVGTRIGIREGDRLFSPLPFFHIAGITLAILVCVTHRATVVSARSFVPDEALAMMESERCELIGALETICIDLLNSPRLATSRLALRGGYAPGPRGIAQRMRDELGATHIINIFGLSEASPTCAAPTWCDPPEVRTDTVGRPLPGVEIRLVDPVSGCECPPGSTGEIQVRGFNVMLGYYRDPEQTRQVLDDDGWLRSGDLGCLGADGNLRIVGRRKEIIRSGGENFSPVEVEELLRTHPAVAQAAIAPVPDARWGEAAWAFVQLRRGMNVDERTILEFCRTHLAAFKLPRRVIFVDQLPLTASGKVQKVKLVEVYGNIDADRGRSQ